MVHWYMAAFYLILPFIARELRLTFSQIGLIMSIRTLSAGAINLPSGALVDLLGRRRLILALTMAWLGLAYLIVASASGYAQVLLGVAVVGIGAGLWHPPAMSVVSERFTDRRALALSTHGVGANIGDSLAPLAVGFILSFLTWRYFLTVNVVPGLLAAFLLWFLLSEGSRAVVEHVPLRQYLHYARGLFRNNVFLRLAFVSAFRASGQNALFTFLPVYLVNQAGLSSTAAGLYLSLLTFAGIFSAPFLGWSSDQVGRKPVLLFGLFSSAVLILSLSHVSVGGGFLIIMALLGLFIYSLQGIIFASAMEVTGRTLAATTAGFLISGNSVLSFLAPVIAGFVADHFGMPAVFYFVGGLLLVSGLLTTTLSLARGRRAASETL
jgi:MFS family permease